MDKLGNKLIKIILESDNSIDMEKNMYQAISEVIVEIVSEALEKVDDKLVNSMKVQGYEIERKDKRKIQFLFGDVTFTRRLYRKGKKYKYALDECLCLKSYKRYSSLTEAKFAEISTSSSFSKSAEAINKVSTLNVSPSGVHKITQRVAAKVIEYTEKNKKKSKVKRKVPILFLEGDGLIIKSQKKRRISIHRFQVHEGVIKEGNRTKTINLHRCTDTSRRKAYKDMLRYLHDNYDLTDTIVLTNSDNGSGYEPEVFQELTLECKQHEHFLDKYHLNRKIEERMYFCDFELIKKMKQAIYEYSKKDVEIVLDTMEAIAVIKKDHSQSKRATEKLAAYLSRNWDYIKPLNLREIEGVSSSKGLGICENSHRPYVYRMKRQGKTWSPGGAKNMVKLIDSLENNIFEEAIKADNKKENLDSIPEPKINMNDILLDRFVEHTAVKNGKINSESKSSPLGIIKKIFNS